MSQQEVLQAAVDCLNRGELDEASRICDGLLRDAPQTAKAWHLLGIVCGQRGDLEDAVANLQKASKCDPENALYHYNLGLAYKSLGKLESAVQAYRGAIAKKKLFLEAHNNLANTLMTLNKNAEAIECFRNMLALFPDSSVGHFNLANLLQDTGHHHEGIPHYQRALELDACFTAARENLGRALVDAGNVEQAKRVWEEWLEHEPDNAMAAHMLAAASGENVPARCDDDYVREAFNKEFAETFDKQLAKLNYRAPGLVVDAIIKCGREPSELLILDAGCGTGLCGPLVKSWADQLIGIDLSQDMLRKAEARKIYDVLEVAEICQYMNERADSFDVVISTDTLCYFGDLQPVMLAAYHCLKPNGVFAFSLEALPSENGKYRLEAHGRYRHDADYVVATLKQSGFTDIKLTRNTLRIELGKNVEGLIVVATCPSNTRVLS